MLLKLLTERRTMKVINPLINASQDVLGGLTFHESLKAHAYSTCADGSSSWKACLEQCSSTVEGLLK